jgi:hypothetical protein
VIRRILVGISGVACLALGVVLVLYALLARGFGGTGWEPVVIGGVGISAVGVIIIGRAAQSRWSRPVALGVVALAGIVAILLLTRWDPWAAF